MPSETQEGRCPAQRRAQPAGSLLKEEMVMPALDLDAVSIAFNGHCAVDRPLRTRPRPDAVQLRAVASA